MVLIIALHNDIWIDKYALCTQTILANPILDKDLQK